MAASWRGFHGTFAIATRTLSVVAQSWLHCVTPSADTTWLACAQVNGVGGIGKSSVAREYAFLFRPEYLGGQFEIDLSTAKSVADVQSALVRIARSYLKANIPYELPEDRQYELAKAAFHNLPAGEKVLLLLDNLNEDAVSLVARKNRDLYPSLEKVHMLVTTRAEPRSLGGIETISLDILPVSEALDLLFRYRAFARQLNDPDYLSAREGKYQLREDEDATGDAEWKAALAIVQRLGRHSLAVALVGAYLGSYPDISYRDFADQLREQGIGVALDFVGLNELVQNLIAHPVTLIGPLFEQSVARLSPLVLRTLEYATLLPPDLVPLAWLQQLVEQDAEMAEFLQPLPFQPPHWEGTLRTLFGLDYLKGEPFARMHRVVQEVILARMSGDQRAKRTQRVRAFVENRTAMAHDNQQPYTSVSEVDAVVLFVQSNAKKPDRLIGRTAMWVVPRLQELGRLRSAVEMASLSEQILRPLADSDPGNVEWQRDLSVSLSQLGELAALQENIPEAKQLFSESLGIRHRLVILDPTNGSLQRDLFVASIRLGKIDTESGNLDAERKKCQTFLDLNRRNIDLMPANTERQRDLAVTLERLGDIAVIQGDRTAADGHYSEMYEIRQRLAESDPGNAVWQRDLSVALDRLGEQALTQGSLLESQRLFGESHVILQHVAESDPGNAMWQRDLAVSHHNLAMLAQQEGNNAQSEVELRACFDVLNGMCQRSMHLDPEMEQVYQQLSEIFDV